MEEEKKVVSEEEKVIFINRDPIYFLKKAKKAVDDGKDFKKALSYVRIAERGNLNARESLLANSIRANAYLFMDMAHMSVFYCYKIFNLDGIINVCNEPYPMLIQAFFMMNKYDIARFYANEYLEKDPGGKFAKFVKTMLFEMDKLQQVKQPLQLVDNEYLSREDIFCARESMSKGNINDAIKYYEQIPDRDNDDLRNELVMAYFFAGDYEKANELISAHGSGSVQDLISQMMIEYSTDRTDDFEKTKQKLLDMQIHDAEKRYRVGAAFSQLGETKLAVEYMRDYVESGMADPELEFLYCIACINCGKGEQVKKRLLDLKLLDPFDNYIFDFYIKACGKPGLHNFNYTFNVPRREENQINAKVKEMLVMSPEALMEEMKNNTDLFYYIAKQNSNTSSLLLLKLAAIDDFRLEDFFDVVLFGRQTPTKLKNKIFLKRVGLNCSRQVAIVRDDIYSKIVLPNNLATKTNNPNLYKAISLFAEYILNALPGFQVSITRPVIKMERRIKGDEVDEKILAAYLSWDVLKANKHFTLSKICNKFKITQEELFNFTIKYTLDV